MYFQSAKSKKSLVFAEFPVEEDIAIEEDSFPYEHIFLISTSDPWYRDMLIYIHTLKCPVAYSREERCKLHVHAKKYLIRDTLDRRGVDPALHRFLTHEEAKSDLNDSHR